MQLGIFDGHRSLSGHGGQHDAREIRTLCGFVVDGGYDVVLTRRDFGLYPLYKRLGNAALAEKEYRAALALSPRMAEALSSLANLLLSQGRTDEAHAIVSSAVESWAAFYGGARKVDVLFDRRHRLPCPRSGERPERRARSSRDSDLQERGVLVIPRAECG